MPDEVSARDALPADEAWATFPDVVWAYYLACVRQEVNDSLSELEERVLDGERPTMDEVHAARSANEQAETLVEKYEEVASPRSEG